MKAWKSIYLSILYSRKRKTMVLKQISILEHDNKKQALGYAYTRGCSYMKKGDPIILWDGGPSYSTQLYNFVVVSLNSETGIDMSSKSQIRNFRKLFDEMYNDCYQHKIFQEKSLELSKYAWQNTIPKGYKLLRVGAVIKEGDKEYDTHRNFWGGVSWYNIDKKVKKGNNYTFTRIGQKPKVYKGENEPLIIRKS